MTNVDALLESYQPTQELRRLGFKDEDLAASRFSPKYLDQPFDEWPFTFPVSVTQPAIAHLKRYLAYHWALIEGPRVGGIGVAEAYRYVSDFLTASDISRYENYRKEQANRAKKPRSKIFEDGRTIVDPIQKLANNPGCREMSAAELWPHFLHVLDDAGLDPEENGSSCTYFDYRGKMRKISFSTFQNHISKLRKSSASR